MKRLVLFLPSVFFLSGCAQLFDSNLYQGIDTPPELSASNLSKKSITDIQSMTTDETFFTQLKSNPAALDAAQGVLEAGFSGVTTSSTSAEKEAALSAAQTYVEITSKGSDVAGLVSDVTEQLASFADNSSTSDVADAVTSLVSGKSEAQIVELLTNLTEIGSALSAMQTAATSGTSVDADTFFGDANKGDLATTAVLAAAVTALVADDPTSGTTADKIANLAAILASGDTTSMTTNGSNLSAVVSALSGTVTTSNAYAYLNAVTSVISL